MWISTKERLPEENQEVFAVGQYNSELGNNDEEDIVTATCIYSKEHYEITNTCYYSTWLTEVQFWMPIPPTK